MVEVAKKSDGLWLRNTETGLVHFIPKHRRLYPKDLTSMRLVDFMLTQVNDLTGGPKFVVVDGPDDPDPDDAARWAKLNAKANGAATNGDGSE